MSFPIKDNVSDIYSKDEYRKWTEYSSEKSRIRIIETIVDFVFFFLLLLFDVFAFISKLSDNVFVQGILIFSVYSLVDTIIKIPTSYINQITIEEKYGFNKSTTKTFVMDLIKEYILSNVITIGLLTSFISLYGILGDWIILAFSAVVFVILLFAAFLTPLLSKLYNKFRSLEDGELRTKLIGLLEKNGYKVKDIKVMDGSKRSTKANAYFAGFGRTKTIVLYDTIIDLMDEDELVGVFAHELAHGKYKHVAKNMLASLIMIGAMIVTAWCMIKLPICEFFGFSSVNYCFIMILLLSVIGPFISLSFGMLSNYLSRKHEYEADALAAREGYGQALISGLKKLSKNNFSNLSPHPIIVLLAYSHPPISERIDAITKIITNEEKETTNNAV